MPTLIKAGVTTSEFWVVFIAGVITALGKALELPEPVVSWLNGLALFYLTSRTTLKAIAAKKVEPKQTTVPLIILTLGLISFLAGCGLFNSYARLSPLDKAVVTADRLAVWYADTHKVVSDSYAAAPAERQAFFRKEINPKMNDLKKYILGYVDAVNLWRVSGREPPDLAAVLAKIDVLCRDVLFALKE